MPKQRLYYEYIDQQLLPFWYVLSFETCEINWEKPIYNFDAIKPFEFIERDQFDDSLASFSISLSDFVFNNLHPKRIGINLNSVRKRIERYGVDPEIISQFIVTVPDVNDLLQMLPIAREMSFKLTSNSHQDMN